MKIAAVELPDGLRADFPQFQTLSDELEKADAALVVLIELPFGTWPATHERFDPARAIAFVQNHERQAPSLATLPTGAVLTTRPRMGERRLVNEAILQKGTDLRVLRQKRIFPQEPGYFEQSWFETEGRDEGLQQFGEVSVGTLVCTELMFPELAREIGRRGAHVIAVPRATGDVESWILAARMAALVSGCYVITSNRRTGSSQGQTFAGTGMIVAPGGEMLALTSETTTCICAHIDLDRVRSAQASYPCYVREQTAETAPA